jgi:RND family efflux transporter MFP subunit
MEPDLSKLSIDPATREGARRSRAPAVVAILAAAAILVVALALVFGRRPTDVRVASVRNAGGARATVLNASGYVTPRRRATVSAKVTGKIRDVLIDEGMHVDAGQVLARLDDTDARAALRAAESGQAVAKAALEDLKVRLANARRALERSRELRARELVSEEALDNAETAVASYEAQLALAEEQVTAAQRTAEISGQDVDNCVVRAPFAGIIVSKDAQPGEMVSPISAGGGFTRTGIATIVDMRSLEIEVDVNESYIARVVAGQRVEAVLDAYPDWRIPSKVRTVIPTADRQKATVKVRIAFDALDPRILPDMGVKVSFLEDAHDTAAAAVVLVPREAVRREAEKTTVFVLRDDRVERRAVQTGHERGADIEITAGLRNGEQVVIWAGGELRDGARVQPRE